MHEVHPEVDAYRPLSRLAAIGLLLGLASMLAWLAPLFWLVPIVALVVNLAALWHLVRRAPQAAGRTLAGLGLALAIACGVGAPTVDSIRLAQLRAEGRQFALEWFGYLAADQPERAFQLTLGPGQRWELDDRLWRVYQAHPSRMNDLERFVDDSTIRVLLALGEEAQVRYYKTEDHVQVARTDRFLDVYAVTFRREGRPTTFFVLMKLACTHIPGEPRHWQVLQVGGGYRPLGWPADAAAGTVAATESSPAPR